MIERTDPYSRYQDGNGRNDVQDQWSSTRDRQQEEQQERGEAEKKIFIDPKELERQEIENIKLKEELERQIQKELANVDLASFLRDDAALDDLSFD